jgi:tetratricopeptide (TPR) repeat protein
MDNEISLKTFLHTVKESCKNDGRYCFILGAGSSKESGIKTGIELAKIWTEELKERYSEPELKDLMKKLDISDISVTSKNYFDIYALRFYPDYHNGYAYIEKMMEHAQPSYGYYPLAMQLANSNNNLVITTNFDCMIEDSLFIYTDKRPIVVGHELLANYININTKRPMIAKIHRSLFFEPFNRREELNGLSEAWKRVLGTAFQIYTPIVIGYAGGDNSLMQFLQDETVQMKGLYWCYYKGDTLSEDIRELVLKKKGYLVPMDGFDSMMFYMSEIFEYTNPNERITEVAENRIKMYDEAYNKFSSAMKSIQAPDEGQSQVINLLKEENDRRLKELLVQYEVNPKDKNVLTRLANYYYNNKEHKKAEEYYTRVIKQNPNLMVAYSNRANNYIELGEYKKAIQDINKEIEINPEYAGAYLRRGFCYRSMKKYKRAIEDYQKAIELKPDFAEVYNNRGLCYRKLKMNEKAFDDYRRAIEIKPNYAEAYNNRGCCYRDMREYEKAFEDFRIAIEMKPDMAEAYSNRGATYARLNELYEQLDKNGSREELQSHNYQKSNDETIYEKAISDLNKAIELRKDYVNSHQHLGAVYFILGKDQEALASLNKAIELDASSQDAYRVRAEIYKARGEMDKVAADIQKVNSLKAAEENSLESE